MLSFYQKNFFTRGFYNSSLICKSIVINPVKCTEQDLADKSLWCLNDADLISFGNGMRVTCYDAYTIRCSNGWYCTAFYNSLFITSPDKIFGYQAPHPIMYKYDGRFGYTCQAILNRMKTCRPSLDEDGFGFCAKIFYDPFSFFGMFFG